MKESASRISEAESSSADRKRLTRESGCDKVECGQLVGFDSSCIVTKVFTLRFIQSSVGSLRILINLTLAHRQKKIAGICKPRTEPAYTSEHVQIFDLFHCRDTPLV